MQYRLATPSSHTPYGHTWIHTSYTHHTSVCPLTAHCAPSEWPSSHGRHKRGSFIVRAGAGAKAISAGYWHSLVLKTDDTVWATGMNGNGELGDGTTSDKNTFVEVFSGQ